jgi:hypothetical protein
MKNATRVSPLDHRSVVPPQRAYRWDNLIDTPSTAGGHWAMAAGPSYPRRTARRVTRWRQLDAIEQQLLVIASRDSILDQATSWSDQPATADEINATRLAAGRLYQLALIGFFLVTDGYPDVSSQELETVLGDCSFWQCDNECAQRVGMFLTTAGEDLVLRLWHGG